MESDLNLFDYLPWDARPRIRWPDGKRVAFWVAPNIEFYELDPPTNPHRTPWPRPYPAVLPYAQRDHGNRVGHWRMMEVMDRCGVKGSISLSVALIQHHPEIIEACAERGWEFFSHGIYNTRYCYGMDEAQERAIIRDSIRTVQEATGQRIQGWLAPALSHTVRTMDLLADEGLTYTCDLFHDDQPGPVNTASGRLVSIPYSLEMNDVIVYNSYQTPPDAYGDILKRNLDRLRADAEAHDTGVVMCIPLHAYLVGQAHRLRGFARALEYITAQDDVWVTRGVDIAQHFAATHFDEFKAAAAKIAADYPGAA